MAEPSAGVIVRDLKRVQSDMKRVRKALQELRSGEVEPSQLLAVRKAAWLSLTEAHRALAAVSLEAANDDVMTRQLAVQRYATALLVRVRRLNRNPDALGDDGEGDDDE